MIWTAWGTEWRRVRARDTPAGGREWPINILPTGMAKDRYRPEPVRGKKRALLPLLDHPTHPCPNDSSLGRLDPVIALDWWTHHLAASAWSRARCRRRRSSGCVSKLPRSGRGARSPSCPSDLNPENVISPRRPAKSHGLFGLAIPGADPSIRRIALLIWAPTPFSRPILGTVELPVLPTGGRRESDFRGDQFSFGSLLTKWSRMPGR